LTQRTGHQPGGLIRFGSQVRHSSSSRGDTLRGGELSLVVEPRAAWALKEMTMRITETKRSGDCRCRCNVCDGGTHCRNIGSGCRVRL
jgi:hypothetical protein